MPIVEQLVAVGDTRSNNVGDFAANNSFGIRRIFNLVTHRHLEPFFHQFGNVPFAGMVGKARHGYIDRAFGEHNVQGGRDCNGIVKKGFVKIANPEEQQKIGIPLLDLQILPHHWGVLFLRGALCFAHGVIISC